MKRGGVFSEMFSSGELVGELVQLNYQGNFQNTLIYRIVLLEIFCWELGNSVVNQRFIPFAPEWLVWLRRRFYTNSPQTLSCEERERSA